MWTAKRLMICLLGFICNCCASPIASDCPANRIIREATAVNFSDIQTTYTIEERADLDAAREIVRRYWKSSYEDVYSLLSQDYKKRLKETEGISNAEQFKKSFPATERVWESQFCETAEMQGTGLAKVVVQSQWFEEGYAGVMTFVFDLVKEKHEWKIENIMY